MADQFATIQRCSAVNGWAAGSDSRQPTLCFAATDGDGMVEGWRIRVKKETLSIDEGSLSREGTGFFVGPLISPSFELDCQ